MTHGASKPGPYSKYGPQGWATQAHQRTAAEQATRRKAATRAAVDTAITAAAVGGFIAAMVALTGS
jgi:hypothetical protein